VITDKVDEILQLIEQDRHVSCQEIVNALELRINHVIVWNHLKKAGYAKKFDVWVPHELTQRNLIDRISISETLLKRNEIDPFLKQTNDEKWVKYIIRILKDHGVNAANHHKRLQSLD